MNMYAGKLIIKHKFSMFYQCAEALVCYSQNLAKQATLCSAFQLINQQVYMFLVISSAERKYRYCDYRDSKITIAIVILHWALSR